MLTNRDMSARSEKIKHEDRNLILQLAADRKSMHHLSERITRDFHQHVLCCLAFSLREKSMKGLVLRLSS